MKNQSAVLEWIDIVEQGIKTERFQNGAGLHDLLLNPHLVGGDSGQVLQDKLGGLGLSGTRLTTDNH